jgi:hypothetical protein
MPQFRGVFFHFCSLRPTGPLLTAITRATTSTLAATALLATLAGCTLFAPEIARDDSGQVLEPTVIGSTQLLVGDCFSFVNGSELSDAEVTPCTNDHTHIVIGKGELAKAAISEAGSLQNALSSSCSESFAELKANVANGIRPDQEFIVSERTTDDGVVTTGYTCIATDAPTA